MQDSPHERRRVLVAVTRGGAGALPPGEPVAYALLGGSVASPPPGEPARPPAGPTLLEGVAVMPAAPQEAP